MCLQEIFKNYASGDAIWHILGATETTKKRCVICCQFLSHFYPNMVVFIKFVVQ